MRKKNFRTLKKRLQVHSVRTYNFYKILSLMLFFNTASVFGQTAITPSNCSGNLTNTVRFDFVATPVCANSVTFSLAFTAQGAQGSVTSFFTVNILNAAGTVLQTRTLLRGVPPTLVTINFTPGDASTKPVTVRATANAFSATCGRRFQNINCAAGTADYEDGGLAPACDPTTIDGGIKVSATYSLSTAPATPLITTTAPTCTSAGTSRISNYQAAPITYIFSPAGPSVAANGDILGMATGTNYTVRAANGTCNSAVSSSFTNQAQIQATVISSQSPAVQTVCQNATPTNLSVSATGSGTLSYQWFNNGTVNSTTGGTAVGGNTPTYTPATNVSGTRYYYVRVTGSCGVVTSSTYAVTVNPSTAISSQSPAVQTVCQNATPTNLSVSATGSGTLSYQWFNNGTVNSTTGGTAVGGNTPTYTPATNLSGTRYYYVRVTGSCGAVTSAIYTVTVNSCSTICYDLPNTGAGIDDDTKFGITLLQRAGTDNGNWPMVRKGAHIALESNTKGFVITRVADPVHGCFFKTD